MAVSQRRAGFTLVELLVVVVIIGMLVGLMMPAILSSREKARQVTCINNLKEITTATITFHESRKRLPASILMGQTNKPTWTWVVELLEPLRTDLWESWRSASSGGPTPLVKTFVCPVDTDAAAVAATLGNSQAALSYVANGYFFRPRQYQNGLPTTSSRTVTLTDVKTQSISILFSERKNSTTSGLGPGPWAPFPATNDSRVTFTGRTAPWLPPSNGVVAETPLDSLNTWGISSNHPDVVFVALADNSVVPLSGRTDMSIYIKAQVGIPVP